MADREYVQNIDLNLNELRNPKFQLLAADPGSPVEGQFWFNTTTKLLKYFDGTDVITLGRLNDTTAPDGSVSLNSQKIINLADGVAATDAVNKGQLDAASAGLDVKQSVRVRTSTNVNLASPGANLDGIAMSAGDRFLATGQTAPAENGIYVWNGAAVAATRATDANTSAEVTPGLFTFVEEGTSADTGWVLATNAPIVLDTTGLTFAQFTAAATGVQKYDELVGDGAAITYDVDHNLGTKLVHVAVYKESDGVEVYPGITRSTVNRVVLDFSVAPANNEFRVVVLG